MKNEQMVFGTLSAVGFTMGVYGLWRVMGSPKSLAEISSGSCGCGTASCTCGQTCGYCGGETPCGCTRLMTSGR